jgi:FHA domain/FhaA, N-terminal domain
MPAMTIDPFARFEDSVQRLIEGGLARLFAGRLQAREVALQIVRCMEDQSVLDELGRRHAPDIYTVRLNPDDQRSILAEQPDICHLLGQELLEAAQAAGLLVSAVPLVTTLADPSIRPNQVFVAAAHSKPEHDSTETMDVGAVWEVKDELHPTARLLMDCDRVIPLNLPLLNLGRSRDNQIVLDDPAVSRYHAQVRLRFGHYTLFDLGSTVGTLINGQLVREAMLRPGDIITIGSQALIYIEDSQSEPKPVPDDTKPMNDAQHES